MSNSLANWPTTLQVAQIIGRSTKGVYRYVERGRLTKRMRERTGCNGTTEAVYDPRDVERLRKSLIAERENELARVTPAVSAAGESNALSVTRPRGLAPILELPWSQPGLDPEKAQMVMLAALLRLPKDYSLYLPWGEAATYSGLSEDSLRALVAEGQIGTRSFGRGVRLRRLDLDAL